MSPPRFARAPVPAWPAEGPRQDLAALFAATVARQSEAEMLVDGAERLSFAVVAERVRGLAAWLREMGVGNGDVVAYQLPNWWEAVVIFLATAEIGAIANPLLPTFRARELRFTLAESGASVLFIPALLRGFDHAAMIEGLRQELPELRHVVVCRGRGDLARPTPAPAQRGRDRDWPGNAAGAKGEPYGEGARSRAHIQSGDESPHSIMLLMYTSGTTAAPKGVLHTHATLAAEILSLARVHQLGPRDRTLMPSPVTHISGVIHAILTPAILGTGAVLMERWDALEALRLIAAERVTYMAGAPAFLQDLVRHPSVADFDLSSLRLFSCGGAAVPPELLRLARTRVPSCVAKRVYGSTEFPTISTTSPGDALTHGIDTEGRAIAPAEVRIVRDDGSLAAAGEEGELQARGPECFVGYSDPALNGEAFTADGWFRSGDLATLDAAGYLRITGRLKEIIVRKGEKISVREVELLLLEHPAVAEVAVVALPDPDTGERACAVAVPRPGSALSLADVGDYLAARGLARHKHPERLEIVAHLPRTESGKVAKAALVALLAKRHA